MGGQQLVGRGFPKLEAAVARARPAAPQVATKDDPRMVVVKDSRQGGRVDILDHGCINAHRIRCRGSRQVREWLDGRGIGMRRRNRLGTVADPLCWPLVDGAGNLVAT